jgi:hypothetical protein
MRYFVAGWLLLVVMVVGILGFRGDQMRQPPLEIFPDMDRQLKLRPQEPFDFFPDGRSSRLPVPGTIARTSPFVGVGDDAQQVVYPFEDAPINTGRETGTTNYVSATPMRITSEFLERGRQRFDISCAICHGAVGDGRGVTTRFGMGVIRNLHEERIVAMPDGEVFDVITNGRGVMGSYGAQIDIQDRWAIVAYMRALQLSRLANLEDVPADQRANLR